MITLEDYRAVVGDEAMAAIHRRARRLAGMHLLEINSTYTGGGVAEMLSSLIRLLNCVGVDTDWAVLLGSPDFFEITKRFHNALQGDNINLTAIKKRIYLETNEDFHTYSHIRHDAIIVHDVQPLPIIKYARKKEPWIWRCHVDLTEPNRGLWEYLKQYILQYDMMVVSNENYIKKDLPIDQRVVFPAIDPLSSKNMDLPKETIGKTLEKFKIPDDKPIITQISRFDPWKDPEGVLRVFGLVKKRVDCRLVLCGSMADDDPQGIEIYDRVKNLAARWIDNGDVILLTTENNILVNSLQRTSEVVLQKSTREGFGLTVAEALWKETPVVATNVGGIPLQITDGICGYLVEPHDIQGCADRVVELLCNPDLAREMGRKGRKHIHDNFLITRLLVDWMDILAPLLEKTGTHQNPNFTG
jgi:trehalose synthase